MYNLVVWGSVIKPGREEFNEISEQHLKILLWDRFPSGFNIRENWVLVDENRVGCVKGATTEPPFSRR